jgi:hypothetical protein
MPDCLRRFLAGLNEGEAVEVCEYLDCNEDAAGEMLETVQTSDHE